MDWQMFWLGVAIGTAFGYAGGIIITSLCAAEGMRERCAQMRKEVRKARKEAKAEAERDYTEKLETERRIYMKQIEEQKKLAESLKREEERKAEKSSGRLIVRFAKKITFPSGAETDLCILSGSCAEVEARAQKIAQGHGTEVEMII